MKRQFLLIAATAASTASAQLYANRTEPFLLQLKSADAEIDGNYLYACHSGAAIESLCLGGTETPEPDYNPALFYHNYSSTWSLDGSSVGYLTWNLPVNVNGSVIDVSSPMGFQYNPVSNVAVPMLMPGTGYSPQTTLFDSGDELALVSSVDDSSNNSTDRPAQETAAFYSWHACYAFAGGYYYHVLAWVMGGGEPHNPSCVEVDVVRTFV